MPILFVTVLIDLIGFGIIIPILPFIAPPLGASNFDIALIIAIYSVFNGLAAPFWGRLSDRIGRKPVLLICLGGAAASYVLLAFAHTLVMLYVSRALAGAMAGNFGVASAMIADITRPENRAKAMGMIGAAFGLGMVVGPFLGGVLSAGDGDFMLPAMVAAAMSTCALIAGWIWLPESHSSETRARHRQAAGQVKAASTWRMLRESGNTLLAGQYFLANSCHTSVSYLFPLWVGASLGWGAREVGVVFGVQGVAMVVLQAGLIGRFVRAVGELKLLLFGSSLMTMGFIIAGFAHSAPAILVGFFAAITGGTVCTPVLNALVANRTPAALRGRMLGTTSSSSAYGRVCGPMLAGTILSLAGFQPAWFVASTLAVLIALWALSQLRIPTRPLAAGVAGVSGDPS